MKAPKTVTEATVAADPKAPGGKVIQLRTPGAPQPDPARTPFVALGHDRDSLFFIADRGQQLLQFRAHELANKGRLFLLADLQYWDTNFAEGGGFSGAAVDRAVDFLMRSCYARGPFRAEQLRGRGAWQDQGRVVVHVGDRLLVDGAPTKLMQVESRYIYEARPALDLTIADDPLSAAEGALLHRWAVSLGWEQAAERAGVRVALDGTLLAGWIACAAVCGALEWRPHTVVTGPSGTGKSQIIMRTARHLLGGFALRVKSAEATAAGVRQRLGPDALAVTLDEAEADSESAERRIHDMLALMRVSSSEDDAEVLKGSANGQAMGYAMRSAFLLAAVRVPLSQRADQTRCSVLSLTRPSPEDQRRFRDETLEYMDELLDPVWAARFRARMIGRVPELRANFAVFKTAAAAQLGDARMGDQYGALLAGAYVLQRDGVVERKRAEQWIAMQSWERQQEITEVADEMQALAAILETAVTISKDRTRYDFSIGELVAVAAERGPPHREIDPKTAAGELGRRGLLVADGALLVSNTHRGVEKMLVGTSYKVGWSGVLRRIHGAVAVRPLTYGGSKSRGTAIPLDAVLPIPGGGDG